MKVKHEGPGEKMKKQASADPRLQELAKHYWRNQTSRVQLLLLWQ